MGTNLAFGHRLFFPPTEFFHHHGLENFGMFRVLVPRGVLEEKERGTLQRWFDMIDWQGVGIKEEQQAQGGMRFYVRGQKRMKRWVEEQEQAGTEGNGEAAVELID